MMMGSMIFFIFILLFLLFVFGLFSIAERPQGPRRRSREQVRPSVASRARSRARHSSMARGNLAARRAMQRAAYEGGDAYVRVVDIGLLAYRELDEPRLVRYNDVWNDTQYLRPFVGLWVPHAARGTIRMELRDGDDRLRYVDETRYDLDAGSNTLLPGTWLPLREQQAATGYWTLHVRVGDTLLAVHRFGWQPSGSELRHYIEADGEISPELQQALDAQPSQAVSLAQLLSGREE